MICRIIINAVILINLKNILMWCQNSIYKMYLMFNYFIFIKFAWGSFHLLHDSLRREVVACMWLLT